MKAIVGAYPLTQEPEAPFHGIIFNSVFNPYRGAVAYLRIIDGTLRKGDLVRFVSASNEYEANEVGVCA